MQAQPTTQNKRLRGVRYFAQGDSAGRGRQDETQLIGLIHSNLSGVGIRVPSGQIYLHLFTYSFVRDSFFGVFRPGDA